jgi:hypothetical protein
MKAETTDLFGAHVDACCGWLKREWDVIACPLPLIRAVITTYERFKKEGKKPGSEVLYGNNEPNFSAHALPAIRDAWAAETGREPLEFPWETWFAVYSWVSWRKMVKGTRKKVLRRLGLDDLIHAQE